MASHNKNNERELKSILFADVVGYARLMQGNEEEAYSHISNHIKWIEKTCREYQGEVLEVRGDGIFALFNSAMRSVQFASKMQSHIEQQNLSLHQDRKIRFRVGIHLGDVIKRADQHYGDNVNIASRIEGLAHPGGICISSAVHQQIKDSGDYGFENLGERLLKNIRGVFTVYRVNNSPKAAMRVASHRLPIISRPDTAESEDHSIRPSVAVLPFKNTNGNPDFEYFSDGITEDIITNLSKFHNLFVISRNSSFTYKNKQLPTNKIGTELGARYIADGTIRTTANKIRITAQLIDTEKDRTVWADHFDRSLDDVFEIQDEVSAIICNAMSVKVSEQETYRSQRRLPGDFQAYDNLLRGQQCVFRYTRNSMRQARRFFESAIELDQRYGRAWASVAKTLNYEWLFSWAKEPEKTLDQALSYANNAVKISGNDATGHACVGFISLYKKQHVESIEAYGRALSLNPNDADIMADLADTYAHSGESNRAIELLHKAMHLNPFYPDEYLWTAGGAYYNLKQYQQAIDCVMKMNNISEGCRILAASYAQLGQLDMAKIYARKNRDAHPHFSIDKWKTLMPDRFSADTEHFIDGLRKAGVR